MKSTSLLFLSIALHTEKVDSFATNRGFARIRSKERRFGCNIVPSPTTLCVGTSDQKEKYNVSNVDDDEDDEHTRQIEDELSMFFATLARTPNSDQLDGENSSQQPSLSSKAEKTALSIGDALPYTKEISDFISTPQLELIDTGLVLLSSFLVAVGTLPAASLPGLFSTASFEVEEFLSYVFCFGFFLRWYSVGKLSGGYLIKPLSIIDFFASVLPLVLTTGVIFLGVENVPTWLMTNSALANLRLLRILRLQQLLYDMETFGKVEVALGIKPGDVRPYQLQLARVVISIFTLCSVSSGLIYAAEHEVNPMIPDYFTALYFGLTTLTTVGFGDITPITLQGRLVVMGSILAGVTVIPAQGAELFEALLDYQTERRQKNAIKNNLRTRIEGFDTDTMIDPRISCTSCGRRSHRSDAFYCWSCGSKLWQ